MLVGVDANFLSPKASVRAAGAGWRTVVIAPIDAGETVAAFGGSCLTRSELNEMTAGQQAQAIQIDEDLFMVGETAAVTGATINHSCAPNCGIRAGVLVVAVRNIAVGESLAYDHAMSSGSDFNDFECGCGAASCRHKVTGNDWMLVELQLAYRGYFSAYLAKRIAALVTVGAERRAFAL